MVLQLVAHAHTPHCAMTDSTWYENRPVATLQCTRSEWRNCTAFRLYIAVLRCGARGPGRGLWVGVLKPVPVLQFHQKPVPTTPRMLERAYWRGVGHTDVAMQEEEKRFCQALADQRFPVVRFHPGSPDRPSQPQNRQSQGQIWFSTFKHWYPHVNFSRPKRPACEVFRMAVAYVGIGVS